ncbi:hypothetical protein LPJ57_006852, partial [Coemansia sp. RSA 486]
MSAIPATAAVASVATAASSFDIFRQKLYIRGVLGKKNDRAPDGRPYTMRKWTRWYVELRGPVLVFWNLLDTQLAAYLEDITAIVDGRVRPGSADFERTVAHIKNIVLKPSFINITDAACAIVGKLKKRDSVWTLHSSGANRFYMQAVDDRAMNEWVRAVRLSCFEASKLYEYYTSALVNERYSSTLFSQRPGEYHVHVRFSGTNDWVPCFMAISPNPSQIAFRSEETQAQVATIKSTRYAYSIYPDSLDKIDGAMIAKFEGDCDVDASLQPKLEAVDGDRDLAPLNPRDHGSYALVIFQSPADMAQALVETASQSRLCNMPAKFVPDFVPDRLNLYLSLSDIADKSIEIMEPVTARRMLENLASERCPKAGSVSSDQAAGYWTSSSTANADSTGGPQPTQLPWMSDSEGENDEPVNGNHKHDSFVKVSKKGADVDTDGIVADAESQKKKKAFGFLQKGSKAKDGGKRDSTIQPKDASSSNGSLNSKHLKRQSKNSTNTTATTTASSNKDSFRNSGTESVSHASTAPSLPTPVTASAAHGTFGDEASEAIVNLKIVDSPPAVNNGAQFGGQAQTTEPAMRLADDSDSESDAPLGSIVTRLAQNMGSANSANMMQQQPMHMQMQMQRASTVIPGMSGPAQMMGMQQPGMLAHTQSMYGATPNINTANMTQ